MYHLISYLREEHNKSAHRQHKSFKRIEPLGLLFAAFIVLSLSLFQHLSISNLTLPHHEHKYDIQEQFANDERAFMHHSANHDLDTSAKITHRRLLLSSSSSSKSSSISDINYQQKMKELEKLAETNDNEIIIKQKERQDDDVIDDDMGIIKYLIWSIIIYSLFVLFFVLLNEHLSYLQLKMYQLVFANKKLNNILKYTKLKQSEINKPIADILKLTSNNNGYNNNNNINNNIINNKLSTSQTTISSSSKHIQIAPKWSKLLFFYQLISIQCIGIFSCLFLSMLFKTKYIKQSFLIIFASFIMLIGNEFSTRCLIKLQLSYHPNWLNYVLYFLFGSMVVSMPSSSSSSKHRHNNHHHNHHHHNHHNHSHHHHDNHNGDVYTFFLNLIFKIFINIPSFILHLRETKTSRRIFIFLSINFLFMFVEFIYGYWSNSLGLISDACHMLFDCIALMIGLLASYLGSIHATNSNSFSKEDIWLNKNKYSYGYGKIKVMSGFINAIFLVYIGISVLIESFERIIHPPHIHTDQLLIVSVLGLFVNLIGLFFFHDAHMIGHGGECSHGHHDHHHDHHHHDHNIRGIFLHILADTLGSVGVIISSLLIYFFDLTIFDALCSVFIAILIFLTVYPLIKSTSKILLQETPKYVLSSLRNDLSNVLSSVHGIIGFREAHFWESEPGKLIGSIHIQIDENSNQQQLLSQIHDILKQRFGFKNEKDLTIQLEKQSYLDKCDPIHHSVYSNIIPIRSTTNNTKIIKKDIINIDIGGNDHNHNHNHNHQHNHNHHHNDQHDHHHDHHHDHNHNHNHNDDGQHSLSDNSNSSFIKVGMEQSKRT